jgi:hypothetical protein
MEYMFKTKGGWWTGDKDCPKCDTMLYARLAVTRCTSLGHGNENGHQPFDLIKNFEESTKNPIEGTKRNVEYSISTTANKTPQHVLSTVAN